MVNKQGRESIEATKRGEMRWEEGTRGTREQVGVPHYSRWYFD